jgi:hypothetical protein
MAEKYRLGIQLRGVRYRLTVYWLRVLLTEKQETGNA